MTRTRFHQGLDILKQKLLTMGGMAEQAVDRAAQAYRTQDLQLCQLVLEAERGINMSHSEIDELATDLLAMQQPMAVDLRFILAVIKINEDLERVGDDSVDQMNRDIFVAMDKLMHDNPDVARNALDALLIARNLERVADHATNIAEDV